MRKLGLLAFQFNSARNRIPAGPKQTLKQFRPPSPHQSRDPEYFASMEQEHECFHYHRVISRSDVRREYVDRYIDREMDSTFRSFFSNPRTLMYLCGLEGMESGMYRMLARHGLSEGFVEVKEPLTLEEHETWDAKSMKRNVKSGPRSLVEVY